MQNKICFIIIFYRDKNNIKSKKWEIMRSDKSHDKSFCNVKMKVTQTKNCPDLRQFLFFILNNLNDYHIFYPLQSLP